MPKLASYFETKTRESGESFVTLNDDAPEWLQTAVRDAHCGTLPNDWIFSECLAACEAIDEGSLASSDLSEYADSRVDVYTADRYKWASEMHGTSLFSEAEGRAEEMGDPTHDIGESIGRVQYAAAEFIASCILDAWIDNDEDEDEDEDAEVEA